MINIQDYLKEGNHLPDFIKDFHDQKDLFKAIYTQWQEDNEVLKKVSWVDAHVFTIDIFLWWMGLHGYKLQKNRAKNVEFYEAESTINHYNMIRKSIPMNCFLVERKIENE